MTATNSNTPPRSLCILRLSALGDISHTLPIFYTLRHVWPETKITWIIGKTEYELVKGIKNVEFIIFDKAKGLSEYLQLYKKLKNKQFDILLHMQMSLRASMISLLIKANIKVGFDKKRAKDGQWLFTNKKIAPLSQQHVIDSFFGFTDAIGISDKKYIWDLPLSEKDKASAKQLIATTEKYIIISPCSSKDYRNWNSKGYAAIADYIKNNYHYNVILSGGKSQTEQQYGSEIMQYCSTTPLNLIGKTTIPELLSLIDMAEFMISPDSGPAHMATAMNTPVIGLYATTNPDRARPYLSSKWTVNRYPEAINKKYAKDSNDVAWGARVKDLWAMQLITFDDVKLMVDNFMLQSKNKK